MNYAEIVDWVEQAEYIGEEYVDRDWMGGTSASKIYKKDGKFYRIIYHNGWLMPIFNKDRSPTETYKQPEEVIQIKQMVEVIRYESVKKE
jgi:hypothetical protein